MRTAWFGGFLKAVWKIHEIARGKKVHYHEIEVCHMSSRFRRIMNQFKRFMKIGRTLRLHELEGS